MMTLLGWHDNIQCHWTVVKLVTIHEWVLQPNTPTNIFGSYCPAKHLTWLKRVKDNFRPTHEFMHSQNLMWHCSISCWAETMQQTWHTECFIMLQAFVKLSELATTAIHTHWPDITSNLSADAMHRATELKTSCVIRQSTGSRTNCNTRTYVDGTHLRLPIININITKELTEVTLSQL